MAAQCKQQAQFYVLLFPAGAVIQKLLLPDRSGKLEDCVLGFDQLEPYKVWRQRLRLAGCSSESRVEQRPAVCSTTAALVG